VDHHRNISL